MTLRLRLSLLTVAVAVGLALGACAKPPAEPPKPAGDATLNAVGNSAGAITTAVPTPRLSPLDDPGSPLYRKVVYFDYDTAEIRPQYTDLLRTHAAYLYQTPGASLTLEGHTDERGTRDYNLALGDRRADAVKRFMIAEGVPAERMTMLSYGEERPADPGHGEESRALNRRVELVY